MYDQRAYELMQAIIAAIRPLIDGGKVERAPFPWIDRSAEVFFSVSGARYVLVLRAIESDGALKVAVSESP